MPEEDKNRSDQGSGRDSLQSREYRDEQGNVHHHTKEYMERHGKSGGESEGGGSESGEKE